MEFRKRTRALVREALFKALILALLVSALIVGLVYQATDPLAMFFCLVIAAVMALYIIKGKYRVIEKISIGGDSVRVIFFPRGMTELGKISRLEFHRFESHTVLTMLVDKLYFPRKYFLIVIRHADGTLAFDPDEFESGNEILQNLERMTGLKAVKTIHPMGWF